MSKTFDKKKWVKNVLLVKNDRDVAYESFLTALDESKKAFKPFIMTLHCKNMEWSIQH
jgi:hypothetical protein